jgi:hypothetical protein
MKQPENGVLISAPTTGGDPPVESKIAETLICKGSPDRVSLKSCSGAIRDRMVVVVVPGVSVV